jgi:hypothetical protein
MDNSNELLSAPLRTGSIMLREAAPIALALAGSAGVVGAAVLPERPLGLNAIMIVGSIIGALAWTARRTERPLTIGALGLGALALLFAAFTSWRSAPPLLALDVLAVLTVFVALVPALRHGDALAVDRAGPLAYAGAAAGSALRVAVGGPALAYRAFERASGSGSAAVSGAGSVVRGTVLALPVLLFFGALLMSADQTFERLLEGMVSFELEHLVARVVIWGIVTWGVGGMLHAALLDATRAESAPDHDRLTAVGATLRRRLRNSGIGVREVIVALALIDLLFLAFGALQLRWFFGGASSLSAAGLTVAEYARRGFFELVTVSALVLPLLLLANGVIDENDGRGARRGFRVVATTLVGLVLLLLVSAAHRMQLYQSAFGLTEERVYASAFELWLGVVFLWSLATLLRGRAAPFALGALVSAWGLVVGLHLYNPDAQIARVNLARAASGREFDAKYLRELSTDAAPALAEAAPELLTAHPDAQVRCELRRSIDGLSERAAAGADWRSWSWSRWRARRALSGLALPAMDTTGCVARAEGGA